jgi:hypothetical protein
VHLDGCLEVEAAYFGELVLTEPDQAVNAFSSIDRLDGHQHAHLRRGLNHCSVPRQARSNAAQSGSWPAT